MANILVIDDSLTMRQLIKMVLTTYGHTITEAANGEEGVDFFHKNKYDLVVTDINMPRMNGIGVIQEIRKVNATIPIIVVTTESEEIMRKQGFAAGANGWVIKPFKPPQFAEIIKKIL